MTGPRKHVTAEAHIAVMHEALASITEAIRVGDESAKVLHLTEFASAAYEAIAQQQDEIAALRREVRGLSARTPNFTKYGEG